MENPVAQSDLLKALDDLILQEAPPPLAEGEFTIRMIAARAGCFDQKAKRMILGWVRDGRAESVGKRTVEHGQLASAWRLK